MRPLSDVAVLLILLMAGGRCTTVVRDDCTESVSPERLRVVFGGWEALSVEGLQELWATGARPAVVTTPTDLHAAGVEVRYGRARDNAICRCCDSFYFSVDEGQQAVLSSVVFIRSFRHREAAVHAAEELWSTLVAPGEIGRNIRAEGLENPANVFHLDGVTKNDLGTASTTIQIWKHGKDYIVSTHISTPPPPSSSTNSMAARCGPSVSEAELLAAANRYISHYSIPIPAEFKPNIYEVGCNYAVVFSHGTDEAKEDLVLTIDRQGRIKNLPECCELGDCPEFCTPP